jgi:hypothetical protein
MIVATNGRGMGCASCKSYGGFEEGLARILGIGETIFEEEEAADSASANLQNVQTASYPTVTAYDTAVSNTNAAATAAQAAIDATYANPPTSQASNVTSVLQSVAASLTPVVPIAVAATPVPGSNTTSGTGTTSTPVTTIPSCPPGATWEASENACLVPNTVSAASVGPVNVPVTTPVIPSAPVLVVTPITTATSSSTIPPGTNTSAGTGTQPITGNPGSGVSPSSPSLPVGTTITPFTGASAGPKIPTGVISNYNPTQLTPIGVQTAQQTAAASSTDNPILDWLGLSNTPSADLIGGIPNWLLVAGGLVGLFVIYEEEEG